MNVSMADAWNLGWKLASVLRGTARPELLHTYSEERQKVAEELIDFDREFARMLSAKPRTSPDDEDGVDPEVFQAHFAAQGRFTAGVATHYGPSMITGTADHQHLAEGYPLGMRFHSAPVVRLADAKPVQLGHAARADGAWRLYVFADAADPAGPGSRARALCDWLASEKSPLARFTPAGADPDSVIDVRAVFQQGHRDLDVGQLPAVLLPRKGRFGLIDHEKAFSPDPTDDDIFDLRGIDRVQGCMVLVRPDQFVAQVLPLDGHDELADFLAGVLTDAGSGRPAVSGPGVSVAATVASTENASITERHGETAAPVHRGPPAVRPPPRCRTARRRAAPTPFRRPDPPRPWRARSRSASARRSPA